MRIFRSVEYRANKMAKKIALALMMGRRKLIFLLSPNKPVVTVFGSCRQDSIYKYYDVTGIRDGLTYPHYTKEIIQAINYCKNAGTKLPIWAFRNPQIGKKLSSRKSLQRDFNRTNIFVIEVASRLEYIHKGIYIHHELFDNDETVSKVGFPSKGEIERREQTPEELLVDLQTIVDLLDGRRVVFSCHINTRERGSRAELTSEIIEFCTQRNIPIFVPAEMLEFYSQSDLFVDEPVLSHFTEFGHRIAGFRFRETIDQLHGESGKSFNPLVQTLVSPRRGTHEFSSGFGDYLNGAIKTFEMASKLKRVPKVDFSGSIFSQHLENKYISTQSSDIQNIYHETSDVKFLRAGKIFTNKVASGPVSEEQRDFVFRNCLTKKAHLNNLIRELMSELQVNPKEFTILHLRVSDDFDSNVDFKVIEQIFDLISIERIKNKEKMVLLSNSNFIRKHFFEEGIISPEAEVRHSADPDATSASIENTLAEFFLMSNASQIHQFSCYGWGSGFSSLASRLFDIPIRQQKIKA